MINGADFQERQIAKRIEEKTGRKGVKVKMRIKEKTGLFIQYSYIDGLLVKTGTEKF